MKWLKTDIIGANEPLANLSELAATHEPVTPRPTSSETATQFLRTFFGNESWAKAGLKVTVNPQSDGQLIGITKTQDGGPRAVDNYRLQQILREELRKAELRDVDVSRTSENNIWISDKDVCKIERAFDAKESNSGVATLFQNALIRRVSVQGAGMNI